MILAVYNAQTYKEYFLSNNIDVDYSLILEKSVFELKETVVLKIEVSRDGWKLYKAAGYQIFYENEEKESLRMTEDQVVGVQTENQEILQLLLVETRPVLQIMKKYSLKGKQEISIGREKQNIIIYDYHQLVSADHAVIRLRSDGFYIEDISANGIFEADRRMKKRKKLEIGDHINIFGLHIIFLGDQIALAAPYGSLVIREGFLTEIVQRQEENRPRQNHKKELPEYFRRSPRNLPQICADEIEIEAPPPPKAKKNRPLLLTIGPSFTMAIPMMLGCLLAIYSSYSSGRSAGAYMFTGVVTAVSSAILGVIWALTNLRYSQQESQEEEQQRFNAYSNYLLHIVDILKQKYQQNTRALHQMYPSAAVCAGYDRYHTGLWSRNINHQDFLYYRLGTGDIPFQVHISIPKEKFTLLDDSLAEKPAMILEEYRMLKGVPVGIDLSQKRLIGLVGGRKKQGAVKLMHILAVSIAANNSYTDVKMAFIYRAMGEEEKRQWECMKWLPHVWSENRQTRYMASDEVETGDIFFELANIIRMRSQNVGKEKLRIKPYYVLFISDPSLIEGELLAKYILNPQEAYGMTTFLMAENIEQLPNACEDILQNDHFFQGYYNLMEMFVQKKEIRFDHINPDALEKMGRCLCGVTVNEEESTSEIPASLDFFEMYGVHKLEEFDVLDRWRKNRTYHSMRALIGKKAGGSDCYLDIHEKYHGPHGLIAGTTGSGKSELLQTYILSVALNFSPDDVSFFTIDYKGGGMADSFSELPHMVGQISNLSGNQVRRAMISIKSENVRRQKIFKQYGVNNINLYTRLFKNGETRIPIPHLFIIIDEFAELKRQEPQFMQELISVAQVGRSLGVHLILATQKPSGTVDDNIWSNSKFRLCLRVQDRQDSNDMLHKPDAAFITQAGRCYMQVGNDEIYELFQSGWSGAVYNGEEDDASRMTAAILTRTGRPAVVGNFHRRSKKEHFDNLASNTHETTQLKALVGYLKQIAYENGYHQAMQLWLPVLERKIILQEIDKSGDCYDRNKTWQSPIDHSGKWKIEACIGLYDDPVNQAQEPLYLSLADGHFAVCGTVVSGKSVLLQTLIYSLITRYSPETIHIYGLDFSSKMLAPFQDAPHVGGVIFDEELDKIGNFFCMIRGLLDERKRLFRGGNYSQYIQAYGVRVPAILIAIDNFANFSEKTKGNYDNIMMTLAKEGVSYGIFLALSGAGFGMSEIPSRIADNIRNVVALEMSDKFQYMEVLRTTQLPIYPEAGVKGRGLKVINGNILEFQTALCIQAEDDFDRSSQIARLCTAMSKDWNGSAAAPIPEIPKQPILAQLAEREQYQTAIDDPALLPFAYRKADASVFSIHLNLIYCYTISGKAHTGRTNVLRLLAYGAFKKGAELCVMEFGSSKLAKMAAEYEAVYVKTAEQLVAYFKDLTPEFVRRNKWKHQWEEEGIEETVIFTRMSEWKPIFLFITDLSAFFEIIYHPPEGIGNIHSFTETILEKGRLHNIYLIGAIRPEDVSAVSGYKGYQLFTGYKAGVHLGGNFSAQRIFNFQNIPYQQLGKIQKRGLGAAADEEDETIAVDIVLPLSKLQQGQQTEGNS